MIIISLVLAYGVLKPASYAAFFHYGASLLHAERPGMFEAGRLGLNRFLLGLAFGAVAHWFILPFITPAFGSRSALPFVIVFTQLRYLEWSIMEAQTGLRKPFNILPNDGKSALWRLCGITISFITDLPLMLAGAAYISC